MLKMRIINENGISFFAGNNCCYFGKLSKNVSKYYLINFDISVILFI
jgi:hypothetical protein